MAEPAIIELNLYQPVNIRHSLESGQVFRWQKHGEWYSGVIGEHLVVMSQVGTNLKILRDPNDNYDVVGEVSKFLRLDDQIEDIYSAIDTDERIGNAIAAYRGLRILRQDPWECLISFICSANSNIPRISSSMMSIASHYGKKKTFGLYEGYSFPSAIQVSNVGESALRELKLGFRAKYIAQVAEIIAAGNLDLYGLRYMPYEYGKDKLKSLPGVGDKVADCVLLFSLDKLEACPVDRWISRAFQDWYSLNPKLKYEEVYKWAFNKWGGLSGYAQQYLFQSRRLAI